MVEDLGVGRVEDAAQPGTDALSRAGSLVSNRSLSRRLLVHVARRAAEELFG